MKIGSFDLTQDGTFIIAELSANHNGSLQRALDSIQAAYEIGANAVKLQTYTADTMTLDCDKSDFIIKGGMPWDGKNLYALYQEAHTPWQWHQELFDYAKRIGIEIFSTPFDRSAVDFLRQFDPPAYKIASFEITDYDLIAYVAAQGKPIIISTGIATLTEIEEVINICKSVGNSDIILLKCTSAYPAPLKAANLKSIPILASSFGVIAGFSDHTLGDTAPIVAVSLGAKVVEKHFILDRSMGGVDADFSLDKKEFKQMVASIRATEKLLGSADFTLNKEKRRQRTLSRSLYVTSSIKCGEAFTTHNIKAIRPGYGLHPKYLNKVIGKIAKRDYKRGEALPPDIWFGSH